MASRSPVHRRAIRRVGMEQGQPGQDTCLLSPAQRGSFNLIAPPPGRGPVPACATWGSGTSVSAGRGRGRLCGKR